APAPARPAAPERAADPAARQTSLLHRTGLTRAGTARSSGSGYAALRAKVHQRLVEEIADNAENVPAEAVRQRIAELVNEVVAEQSITMTRQERQRVVEVVVHDVLGLGPLEDLLANPEVTEIMVNSHKQIYIEQHGRLT